VQVGEILKWVLEERRERALGNRDHPDGEKAKIPLFSGKELQFTERSLSVTTTKSSALGGKAKEDTPRTSVRRRGDNGGTGRMRPYRATIEAATGSRV